jgi:hypothetical protein
MHSFYDQDPNLERMRILAQACFSSEKLKELEPTRKLVATAQAGDPQAKQELKDRGVWRSGNWVSDYSNWLAAYLFQMTFPAGRGLSTGYATDPLGKTVCVRARPWFANTSFENFRLFDPEAAFDYFIGIFFQNSVAFHLHGVVYAPYAVVCSLSKRKTDKPGKWYMPWSDKQDQLVRLYWDPVVA